jgi:hypothetical protein
MDTTTYETTSSVVNSLDRLLRRVMAEYEEMPGLAVSNRQASCLFGIEAGICGYLLTVLVSSGFLRQNEKGRYVRALGN